MGWEVIVDKDKCAGGEECVNACPAQVYEMVDGKAEVFEFSKPPVELEVRHLASNQRIRMIGVHTKSKSTYGANDPKEELAMMVENRRKQLAQCIWIRQRAEAQLP